MNTVILILENCTNKLGIPHKDYRRMFHSFIRSLRQTRDKNFKAQFPFKKLPFSQAKMSRT